MKIWNYHQYLEFFQRNRSVVLVAIGISILLIVTFFPTIFYIWDPPLAVNDQNMSNVGLCNHRELVKGSTFATSPCSDHFKWTSSTGRNISVLKCDFRQTDKELSMVQNLVGFIPDLEECQKHATPLLCHHMYKDCESPGSRPSTQNCLHVKDNICGQSKWDTAAKFLRTSHLGRCIAMPDCHRDFSNGSTIGHATKSMSDTISRTNGVHNRSETKCKPPLVATELRDIKPYLECSPTCFNTAWTTAAEKTAQEVMLYLSAVISLFCVIITFITWGKVAELRQFPQSTLLYLVIAYAVAVVGFTLPLLVGRRNAYCSHRDLLSTWADPSLLCKIQGSLIHFGFASALIWWLCSIFNVFVSVYAVSPVNPIIRYSKVVFIVEAFMSVMVPIALVSVVLGVHGKYTMFSDQIIVCGPPSLSLFYFSMVLPGQLTVLLGIVMIALIWLRLQKTQKSSTLSETSSTNFATQSNIQTRFAMVIIVFPLSLGVIMSTIALYDKLSADIETNFVEYISCVQTESDPDVCSKLYHTYSGIVTCIIDLIMFDILSIVLLAYVLSPKLARKFWRQQFRFVQGKLALLVTKQQQEQTEDTPGDCQVAVLPTKIQTSDKRNESTSSSAGHTSSTVFSSSTE